MGARRGPPWLQGGRESTRVNSKLLGSNTATPREGDLGHLHPWDKAPLSWGTDGVLSAQARGEGALERGVVVGKVGFTGSLALPGTPLASEQPPCSPAALQHLGGVGGRAQQAQAKLEHKNIEEELS